MERFIRGVCAVCAGVCAGAEQVQDRCQRFRGGTGTEVQKRGGAEFRGGNGKEVVQVQRWLLRCRGAEEVQSRCTRYEVLRCCVSRGPHKTFLVIWRN